MAKIKLTKSAVDAAQPQAKAIELRDTVVPGFLCKITPAGRKVFMLQYRTNAGERRKPALGQYGELTVDQARTMAQEWLAEVRKGGDPSAAKNAARKAPTMKEFCHTFMEDYSKQRNKPSTQRGYRGVIDRCIIPIMGRMKVQDVKRPDVAALMKKLAYKPAEANRTFGVLRKMFNLAELWGLRPDGSNPRRLIQKYPEVKRERYLSMDEIKHLGDVLREVEQEGREMPSAILAIRLLIYTGCRLNEIMTLQWDYVDFEARTLNLPDSKSGAKKVFLGRPACELLEKAPRLPGNPWVITGMLPGARLTDLQPFWQRVRARAGLPEVRIHDLRHTFASTAIAAGHSLPIIGKLLGHTQVQTTARYAHLAAQPAMIAADSITDVLDRALAA